jgi:Transposase IS66 family
MSVQYRYRGRVITPDDIVFLRQLIANNSGLSRRKLSARVCEAWDWKQTNGAVGQASAEATVYEMERLRCNACGQVFTAEEPEGIGRDKYDATATAIIAQLKYGSGVPFTRLERMQAQMGIPLPAATQWELVEQRATGLKPAWEQLIWQAAQGEVLHNDDTGMRILRLARAIGQAHRDLHQRYCIAVA